MSSFSHLAFLLFIVVAGNFQVASVTFLAVYNQNVELKCKLINVSSENTTITDMAITNTLPSGEKQVVAHWNNSIHYHIGGRWEVLYYHQLKDRSTAWYVLLLMPRILCEDAGTFTCTVGYDKAGIEQTQTTEENLRIFDKFRGQRLTADPSNGKLEYEKGSNVTLNCTFEGFPGLEATWYQMPSTENEYSEIYDNENIETKEPEIVDNGTVPQHCIRYGFESNLRITVSDKSKSVKYRCDVGYMDPDGVYQFTNSEVITISLNNISSMTFALISLYLPVSVALLLLQMA